MDNYRLLKEFLEGCRKFRILELVLQQFISWQKDCYILSNRKLLMLFSCRRCGWGYFRGS